MPDYQSFTASCSLIAPRRRRDISGYLAPAKLWCVAACAVVVALLSACESLPRSQMNAQNNLRRFRAAAQHAVQCRAAAARKPSNQVLNEHMPLTDLDNATLTQMVDKKLATNSEIAALGSWTGDVNRCLEPLLREANVTIPSVGPIIEASWNSDTAVFVKLAHRQVTWGEAVISLKSNSTKMRADLIARGDQVAAEIGKLEQAQYDRRTAIITAVIGILP